MVRTLNDAPATDLVYSDEDKVDDTGTEHWDPFFKPDWSPSIMFSANYITHLTVLRRSLLKQVGRFDAAFVPQVNSYEGRRVVQLKILDWRAL